MTFEKFVENMKNNIKNYLPEDYQDAEILIRKVQNINRTYTGLNVHKKDQVYAACISLEDLHELLDHGRTMEGLYWEVSRIVQTPPESILGMDPNDLTVYEKVKNKLFIRVSSAERSAELLKDVPHKIVEGIALTCHICDGKTQEYSAKVNNEMLAMYGVSEEQLFADAIANSERLFPLWITTTFELTKDQITRELRERGATEEEIAHGLELFRELSNESKMSVLTNRYICNGAAVVFYPDTLEKVAKKLGGSFYLYPTSIHEMMAFLDDGGLDPDVIERTLHDGNRQITDENEFLSNDVFHYDAELRMILPCMRK